MTRISGTGGDLDPNLPSNSSDAVYDASQYAFFGDGDFEEVELGGQDDEEEDIPVAKFEGDEFQYKYLDFRNEVSEKIELEDLEDEEEDFPVIKLKGEEFHVEPEEGMHPGIDSLSTTFSKSNNMRRFAGGGGDDLDPKHPSKYSDALFDASQYSFFGNEISEEVELGGLEDLPVTKLEEKEVQYVYYGNTAYRNVELKDLEVEELEDLEVEEEDILVTKFGNKVSEEEAELGGPKDEKEGIWVTELEEQLFQIVPEEGVYPGIDNPSTAPSKLNKDVGVVGDRGSAHRGEYTSWLKQTIFGAEYGHQSNRWSNPAFFIQDSSTLLHRTSSYTEHQKINHYQQQNINQCLIDDSKNLHMPSSYHEEEQQQQQQPHVSVPTSSFISSPPGGGSPRASPNQHLCHQMKPSFSNISPLLEVYPPKSAGGDQKTLEQEPPMIAAKVTIEDGFRLLLDVDDIDRHLLQDGEESQLRQRRQILLQGLATSLQLVDPLGKDGQPVELAPKDDHVFLWLVSISEGRKLFSKYLKYLAPQSELNRIVCMTIFRHLRFLFAVVPEETGSIETIKNLVDTVSLSVKGMDLQALGACLASAVSSPEHPPLRPVGSAAGDGASVVLKAILERGTELLTDPHAYSNCSMPNKTFWQASFDAFFGLLMKYCISKYDYAFQPLLTQGGDPSDMPILRSEAAKAIIQEMPVELLRASIPLTNEDQRNLLLEFAKRPMPALGNE